MTASDNFAEAMKELLNNGGASEPTQQEPLNTSSNVFPSFPSNQQAPTAPPSSGVQQPYSMASIQEVDIQESPIEAPSNGMERNENIPNFDSGFQPAVNPYSSMVEQSDEIPNDYMAVPTTPPPLGTAGAEDVTVISATTTIVGDISVDGCLRVEGNVKGNIFVSDAFESHGKVIGNVEGNDITLQGTAIKGNVVARNAIHVDEQTTVVGDVSSPSGEFRGKIKGNVTVDGLGHFSSSAILVGNLVSGTVIIDQGAMLKGDIEITSAQDDDVTVDELEFDVKL